MNKEETLVNIDSFIRTHVTYQSTLLTRGESWCGVYGNFLVFSQFFCKSKTIQKTKNKAVFEIGRMRILGPIIRIQKESMGICSKFVNQIVQSTTAQKLVLHSCLLMRNNFVGVCSHNQNMGSKTDIGMGPVYC